MCMRVCMHACTLLTVSVSARGFAKSRTAKVASSGLYSPSQPPQSSANWLLGSLDTTINFLRLFSFFATRGKHGGESHPDRRLSGAFPL